VTGTVAVAHGGTGATTLSGLLKGNGESPIGAAGKADLPAHNHSAAGEGGTLYNANGTVWVAPSSGASPSYKLTVTNGIVTYIGAP
jgi:hypothetical protein